MMDIKQMLSILILFPVISFTEKMCTNSEFLSDLHTNKMLSNCTFMTLFTEGIMICAKNCFFRNKCQSFNFDRVSGECHLNKLTVNSTTVLSTVSDFIFSDISYWSKELAGPCADHPCPLNSYCEPTEASSYKCIITECLSLPNVDNGHFHVDPEASAIGTTITLTCDPDYLPDSEVICQDNGTWSEAACVLVTSCSVVKKLLPNSEDGEYWLVLTNISNYRARIYCHDMASHDPQEYLSLPNVNHGIFPQVMNHDCTGDTELKFGCAGYGGEIWFSKINVAIDVMMVNTTDKIFTASVNRTDKLMYGHAHDCYTYHAGGALSCGVRGNFTIDLGGTGWRVSEDQEWETYGYLPFMKPVVRQKNGTWIFLECGGFGGGCQPKDRLILYPHPQELPID